MSDLTARIKVELGDRLTAPMRRVTRQIQVSMGRASQAAEKAAKSMERVRKASSALGSAGQSMSLKVTAPIVAFGGLTLRAAANFEEAMNKLWAISGATVDEIASLKAQARELGKTTMFTATQAAEAQTFLAMAGFDANKILGALPGTLQLAASANMDLGRAADITSNILTGYGKEASELGHLNNVLVGTFTSSNTTLEMLGDSMKYVAPVAKGAGIQFEETAAAIGMMGDAGIQGSMAGRSLRMAIAQLLKPTRQTKQALKGLKINKDDIYDSAGNLKSLADILSVLSERGARTSHIMSIFGTEAGPAMQALMDQGVPKLANFTAELTNIGNVADKVAKAQMKGAKGEIRKMTSALEGLQLKLADSGFLAAFTDVIKSITSWFGELSKASPATMRFVIITGLLSAVLGPLMMALGQIGLGLYGLKLGFAVLKAMQLGSLFMSIAGAIKAVGAALLLNPIGLTITAIGVAAYLLVTRFDDIKKSVKALIGFAGLGLDFIVNKIASLRDAFTNMLPDWLEEKMGIDIAAKVPAAPSVASAYQGQRARRARRGADRAEVGGELHIKIDSEGRPSVSRLKSNTPNFDLDVDAGMVMTGG